MKKNIAAPQATKIARLLWVFGITALLMFASTTLHTGGTISDFTHGMFGGVALALLIASLYWTARARKDQRS